MWIVHGDRLVGLDMMNGEIPNSVNLGAVNLLRAYMDRLLQKMPFAHGATLDIVPMPRDKIFVQVGLAQVDPTSKKFLTKYASATYAPGTPIKEFCLSLDGTLYREGWRRT